jgi:hypothetical protein
VKGETHSLQKLIPDFVSDCVVGSFAANSFFCVKPTEKLLVLNAADIIRRLRVLKAWDDRANFRRIFVLGSA